MSRARRIPLLLLALGAPACVMSEATTTTGLPPEDLLERADLAFRTGAHSDAAESYKVAALGAQQAGAEALFVEACAQVASSLALAGAPEEAGSWLGEAVEVARATEPLGFSRVLLARGLVAEAEGRRADARLRFDELYRYCTEAELFDRAMQAATLAAYVTEGPEQLFWTRRTVESAVRSGERRWEADARTAQAWTFDNQGLTAEALEAFGAARELWADVGTERERLRADWAFGRALRRSGDVTEARAWMVRCLETAKAQRRGSWTTNDSEWVARCHSELGELEAADGRLDEALRQFAAAREAFVLAEAEALAPRVLAALDRRMVEVRALQ